VPNVVKLTRSPAFAVLEPGFESSTESLTARVRVGRVDRWVRRAFVVRAGVTYELTRDANDKEPTWVGEIPLERGKNTLEIKVENIAKATNKRVSTVDCTVQPATVRSITLTANGASRSLQRGERVYVTADVVKLQFVGGGSAPQLAVADRSLAADGTLELTGLREGEVQKLEVRATNQLGPSEPFVVEVVRDTTPPKVGLTTPAAGVKVPTTKPLVLEGTCSDPSGIASVLTAEGAVARVDEKAGTWTLTLAAPKASFVLKLKARDRAGNEAAPEFAITVE
jgi:hypothetical protein